MAEPTTGVDAVNALEEHIEENKVKTDTLKKSAENKKATSSSGKISNSVSSFTALNALDELKQNPIIGAGIDTATQAVTGVAQGLVSGLTDLVTKASAPFQSVVDTFFSGLAILGTVLTEIGMELARNAGRELLKTLDEKDKTLAALETEIVALGNAVTILAHANPFLQGYLTTLIDAYNKLGVARRQFNNVSVTLDKAKRFNKRTFDQALSNLTQAKILILPDPTASLNIRTPGTTDPITSFTASKTLTVPENNAQFISAAIARPSNKDAVAAALAIPGITYRIGQLMLKYSDQTFKINNLIDNFSGALGAFIAAYERSDTIDRAVINHINSGVTQMDGILDEMQLLLFPTAQISSSLTYAPTVTTSATFWGMKVATVVEWMKFTPIKSLQQLDTTGESVRKYNLAVAALADISDIKYTGGTNKVSGGKEDGFNTLVIMTETLVLANTVLVRTVSPFEARTKYTKGRKQVLAMKQTSGQIRNAVDSFIKTPFATVGPAKQILGSFLNFANILGLDKIASYISIGAVESLFAATADTASSIGSAIAGINNILGKMGTNPNVSQQDLEKVTAIRDELQREKTSKSIEAQRSSDSTADQAIKQRDAQDARIKDQLKTTKEAAKRVDAQVATEPDLRESTANKMGQLIPNLNVNTQNSG